MDDTIDGTSRALLRKLYDQSPYQVSAEVRAIFREEDRPAFEAQQRREADERERRRLNDLRQQENADADALARLSGSTVLPATLPTLAHLPKSYHEQYERAFDGTFKLAFIYTDDEVNVLHHMDGILSGKVRGVPRGYNPDDEAREVQEREKLAHDILAKLDADDAAALDARRQQEIHAATAAVNSRYTR